MRSTVAAVTLAFLFGCKPAAESVAPVYESAEVETRDIEVTVDAAGVIEPEAMVEVKSKASGEVLAVHAETGDIVQAGALLVEIDKRTPQNRLAETQAALTAARGKDAKKEDQEKAYEEYNKVYQRRSEFMKEEMTGFVWLYLQK